MTRSLRPGRSRLAAAVVVAAAVWAPAANAQLPPASSPPPATVVAASTSGGTIDSRDRAEVIDGYNTRWLPARGTAFSWTGGSVAACQPGTPSTALTTASLTAVNYLRDQAGVSPVAADPDRDAVAQQTALIMEANQQNSHYPPESWKCWTAQGAEGAASSNLALGVTGVAAIEDFMSDPGATNTFVGHRGFILDDAVTRVGFGFTPGAHAMHVVGPDYDPMPENYQPYAISWPTSGYFPEGLLPGSRRWSYDTYGTDDLDVNLSTATVTVTRTAGGSPVTVPVQVEHRDVTRLVFTPSDVLTATQAGGDVTYQVRIGGVRTHEGAAAPAISYQVTVVPGHATHTWTTRPTITGAPVVGRPLTASAGTYTPSGGGESVTYTWRRDDKVVGQGATYTPGYTDVGYPLTVEVKVTAAGGVTGGATLAHTGQVGYAEAPVNTTAPVLSGTDDIGSTLTVSDGTWNPAPAYVEYQWFANNQPVPGATAPTLTLTPDLSGARVHALVTAFSPAGESADATSNVVVVDTDPDSDPSTPPVMVVEPVITGDPRVGSTLLATAGSWRGAVSHEFAWFRGTIPISGATQSAYAPTAADIGERLRVRVRAVSASGLSSHGFSTLTTYVTRGPAPVPQGKVTLSGTARVGKTLRAGVPAFAPGSAKVMVAWLRNGNVIAGADGETYRLRAVDKGKRVHVRVRASLPGHQTAAVTSPKVTVRGR